MMEALVKLYEEIGFEAPDVLADYRNNYLSEHKCRNGRDVLWYIDENRCLAIYIDTLEFLTEEEIEDQLC